MLVLVCKLLKFPKLIFLCQRLKLGSYCIYFRTCSTKTAIHICTVFCVSHSHDHKTLQFCIGTFKWEKKKKKRKLGNECLQIQNTFFFPSSDFNKYQQVQYLTYKVSNDKSPELRPIVKVLKMRRPFPRESEIAVWV